MTPSEEIYFEKLVAVSKLLGHALSAITIAHIEIKYTSDKVEREKLSEYIKSKYDDINNQFKQLTTKQ